MGLLDSFIEEAARLNVEMFGEDVVYTPLGGTPRTIKAKVLRSPRAVMTDNGIRVPTLQIEVRNHATEGILSSAMNQNGADRVTVAVNVGEAATSLGVYLPAEGTRMQDAGKLLLDLR